MRIAFAEAVALLCVVLVACVPPLSVIDSANPGGDATSDSSHNPRPDGTVSDIVVSACSWPSAGSLSVPGTASGSLSGASNNNSSTCLPAGLTAAGPDQVYTLVVSARSGVSIQLRATAGSAGALPILMLRSSCADVTTELACTAGVQQPGAGVISVVLDPGTYFVIVDEAIVGDSGAVPVPYGLTLSTFAPGTAPNGSCATATAVTSSNQTFTFQHTQGGNDTGGVCGHFVGPSAYYSVIVPSGSFVGAKATLESPQPADGVNVDIVSSCSDAMCFGTQAVGGSASAPQSGTAQYTNTSGSMQTVIIAVSALAGSTSSDVVFDLVVSVGATQYAETAIPVSCDNLANATLLTPMGGGTFTGDSSTAPIALPFALNYFGQLVGYISGCSNGFAQVYQASTAVPSTAFANTPLPSPNAPLGMLAAFWQDLVPATGATAASISTTSLSNGDGTTRFVMGFDQWVIRSDPGVELSFQIKLFSGTSAIEFHYCSIVYTGDAGSDPNTTGGGATIGLQSIDGTEGWLHSFDTAGAVSSASALRFTPVM